MRYLKVQIQQRRLNTVAMKSKQPLKQFQPLLDFGHGGVWMNLVDDDSQRHLLRYSQMQNNFKPNEQVMELLDYRNKKIQTNDISEKESVEDQDALRLMMMICGGYVQDDFATHLSYNDFQQKKEDFGVLKNIYQSIQKKYHNRKLEETSLKFRSLLLMVFLEENIPKMSRVRIDELFRQNKIVW